jgi:hypothetical protein
VTTVLNLQSRAAGFGVRPEWCRCGLPPKAWAGANSDASPLSDNTRSCEQGGKLTSMCQHMCKVTVILQTVMAAS